MIPLLTSRAMVVLGLGALALLGPVISTIPPIWGFSGLMLSLGIFTLCAINDYIHSRRFFNSIKIESHVDRRIWFGITSKRVLIAQFSKLERSATLELNVCPPVGFETLDPDARILGTQVTKFEEFTSFVPYVRGTFNWSDVWLRLTPYRGVLTFQRKVRLSGEINIIVMPNPRAANENEELVAQKQIQVGSHRYLAGLRGREFDGLRRYQSGDDTRHIDWKRSARGTGLVLKTYRPETHQRITVAIDCGRRMSSRIDKILQLDVAVDAAARLVRTAVANGDEIGCFGFGDAIQADVRVAKGTRHEELVANALQTLTASLVESDYTLLSDWIGKQRRRSLLIVITSFSNSKGLEAIRWVLEPVRSRHLVLVVIIADRELQSIVESAAGGVDDAYVIAAASEQIAELNNQMQTMRRLGFECIYADANDIGQELHEAYLRCKMSGRL